MNGRADLQMAFELASLREMVSDLARLPDRRAGELWQGARETMEQIQAARDGEIAVHRRNYEARIEAQKAAVRDDDKPPRRDFEPEGYGGARFDERMVERVARARVEYGHRQRLSALDRQETQALQAIAREARGLLRKYGKAERDFNQASHGRGHSRRRRQR